MEESPKANSMRPLFDPRLGDFEDDASSPKQRSLVSLAGNVLAEISLPKLVVSWVLMLVVPSLLLGIAPIVATAWLSTVKWKISTAATYLWPGLMLTAILVVGWFGWRPLYRATKGSFWALNSLTVEPVYLISRETLRYFAEMRLPVEASESRYLKTRAVAAAIAGILICGLALAALVLAWPSSRWTGTLADLRSFARMAPVAFANSTVIVSAYLAAVALVWGMADALMAQPRRIESFPSAAAGRRIWRVAHLSDVHTVGEHYGFRIESGRSGPRGNERLKRVFARLDEIHAKSPLDLVLITGDMTDAGRSSEWAEFLEALAPYPRLAERVLLLPGNHDLNVADRANPARMELPTNPNRRLRQLRMLSIMAELQGQRVQVVDHTERRLGPTLAEAIAPHRAEMESFIDAGKPRFSKKLANLWETVFPMVVPPATDDGLGTILLNSNADTQFSFTNALGTISAAQLRGVQIVAEQFPRAAWLVGLHHHPVEYPRAEAALAERIGTALINGNRFLRRLKNLSQRVVLFHGHRHVDWIGRCAGVTIVSAPSPVMGATDAEPTCFYIHSLTVTTDGSLYLLAPERIVMEGETKLQPN